MQFVYRGLWAQQQLEAGHTWYPPQVPSCALSRWLSAVVCDFVESAEGLRAVAADRSLTQT
eukprot:9127487-Alexandrium_andersonii.AAC.1